MKTKMVIIICVLVTGILFFSREYTDAQTNSPISRIGVVNIEKVLMECDATKTYSEELGKERQAILNEQVKIKKDILAIEEELASYKVGSPEYLSKLREGTLKKQNLDLEEFNRQEMILKSQVWHIKLYNKIMKVANEIGAEKDLYLVLSMDEPEISEENPDEFTVAVKTRKVLYSGGCMDLTDIVISRLNQLK